MKCLICGNQSSRMDYCWTCRRKLDKDTGLNFKQIKELETLLQQCHSLQQLMTPNDYQNLQSFSKIAKIFSFFFSDEIEENLDLNTLIDLESKLQYILKQLELGTVEIPNLPNEMITENYLKILKTLDNTHSYASCDIQILKIYQACIHLNIKNMSHHLILFPQFMNPIIKANHSQIDKGLYSIEELVNIPAKELFHNDYFYIPGHSFLKYTDHPLTPYEAGRLLLENYQNDWGKLTESDFDQQQIEKIGVSYQLKRIENNYICN